MEIELYKAKDARLNVITIEYNWKEFFIRIEKV